MTLVHNTSMSLDGDTTPSLYDPSVNNRNAS